MALSKKRIFFLSAATLLFFSAFSFTSDTSLFGLLKQDISIQLKWRHNPQFAGIYVAEKKGYFKEKNLHVTLYERDKQADVIDRVEDGKLDFAIVGPLDLFKALERGEKIKAVAAFYQDSPSVIVARKDSGINSPKDLANKTLSGFTPGTQSSILYEILLNEAEVDGSSISYRYIGFEHAKALAEKKVDAVSMYRTNLYLLQKNGVEYTLITPENFGIESYDDFLITSDSMIEKNPVLVRDVVKAIRKGWDYTFAHPEEALEITRPYEAIAYHDKEYERDILKRSKELMQPLPEVQIGTMHYLHMRGYLNMLKKYNVVKGDLKIEDIFTTEFLNN
ncbi:MAG: hypothetical protein RLZZ455_866 [Candidatus Parcubacteria bacterium]|jgi:ABC-type nitrate/sulfonate/bicarbonate transport system substrate-binding protein